MKTEIYGMLVTALLGMPVMAEVPVYRDNQLILDEVVTISDAGSKYYSDVVLESTASGSLNVKSARRRPLAVVDEAQVTLFAGNSLQASVRARGLLSVPCVALEAPAVSRAAHVFTVVLAESALEPEQVCMSLLAVTPFEVALPLPLQGLSAGSYEVRVNNITTSFTLDQDQP